MGVGSSWEKEKLGRGKMLGQSPRIIKEKGMPEMFSVPTVFSGLLKLINVLLDMAGSVWCPHIVDLIFVRVLSYKVRRK